MPALLSRLPVLLLCTCLLLLCLNPAASATSAGTPCWYTILKGRKKNKLGLNLVLLSLCSENVTSAESGQVNCDWNFAPLAPLGAAGAQFRTHPSQNQSPTQTSKSSSPECARRPQKHALHQTAAICSKAVLMYTYLRAVLIRAPSRCVVRLPNCHNTVLLRVAWQFLQLLTLRCGTHLHLTFFVCCSCIAVLFNASDCLGYHGGGVSGGSSR